MAHSSRNRPISHPKDRRETVDTMDNRKVDTAIMDLLLRDMAKDMDINNRCMFSSRDLLAAVEQMSDVSLGKSFLPFVLVSPSLFEPATDLCSLAACCACCALEECLFF